MASESNTNMINAFKNLKCPLFILNVKYEHDQTHYNIVIFKSIQFKYVVYKMGQTLNNCGFRQIYSLHLNIIGTDLAANRPDPVRILDVGTI